MDVLHKIVTFFTNPLTIGMAGLVVALVLTRWPRRVRTASQIHRVALGLSLGWIYLWSTPMVMRWVGGALEREFPPAAVETYPVADAICLLGGGMGVNTNACVYPEMELSADRVWMAAKLWKAGKAKVVTISGGGAYASTIPLLADFGIPTNAVVAFESAKNTEDEARLIAGAMREARNEGERGKGVLLVTSAWHMRRAKWLFERAGLGVVPAPCDHECTSRFGGESFGMRELLPDAETLYRNTFLWKEHFAYWCYRLLK